MAMMSTSDFKKGSKVIVEGDPYEMLEVNFVKPGKGQALYKCRLRNLLKGTMLDRTYKSGDGLEAADVHRGDGQFLYKDPNGLVFMEQSSFEQFTLPIETAGDQARFMMDGMICELLFWNNTLIGMTPPSHVTMKVVYTEPATRGNTSGNVTKAAKLESGAEIQVPAFVDIGDVVKVDTRDGSYAGRVSE